MQNLVKLSRILWVTTDDLLEKVISAENELIFHLRYLYYRTNEIGSVTFRLLNYELQKEKLLKGSDLEKKEFFDFIARHSKECLELIPCFWYVLSKCTEPKK